MTTRSGVITSSVITYITAEVVFLVIKCLNAFGTILADDILKYFLIFS